METLISYKNDEKLKEMFIEEIENHRKLDKIIQGSYGKNGDNFKGCAVGCSIHSLNVKLHKDYSPSDHSVYEKELGIPEWLARLEDTLFEGLPIEDAKNWPTQFAEAVPVGVNLEPVKWKFCAYLMKENIDRVLELKDISDELKKEVVDAIRLVLHVHEMAIETGKWNESAANSAYSVADSARLAAYSAANSAYSAANSAYSAANSANSARLAAYSAANSAYSAYSAANSANSAYPMAYIKYSKELLTLLKNCK